MIRKTSTRSPIALRDTVELELSESVDTVRQPVTAPPAEWLTHNGWIQPRHSRTDQPSYHLLTPEAVLAPSFLSTHCFKGVLHTDSAWIGLTFEPRRGSTIYDVQGAVWVDTRTGLLRRLQFTYTRLAEFLELHEWQYAWDEGSSRGFAEYRQAERQGRSVQPGPSRVYWMPIMPNPDENEFGGTIEFGFLSGTWDIVEWEVRWPVLRGGAHYVGNFRRGGVTMYQVNRYTHIVAHWTRATTLEVIDRP